MNNLQISQRDFCQPPQPFHRLWTVVLQVDMLEQRSAEKERALQNEVVGSTGGGLRHSKMTPWGWSRGWRERERFKRLFFGGRGVMCEIFGGVAFCENMSFPFSDFIWSFTWIMLWKKSCTSWDMKLMQDLPAGGDVWFLMIHLWKIPFQHRILVLSCS